MTHSRSERISADNDHKLCVRIKPQHQAPDWTDLLLALLIIGSFTAIGTCLWQAFIRP